MKVKKSQRFLATFNGSLSHLCSCLVYTLFAICLIETLLYHQMHANAYISRTNNNRTNSIQHFNASRKSSLAKRNGRFLFDAFFGIETPPLEPDEFDDEEEEDEPAEPCKCGK